MVNSSPTPIPLSVLDLCPVGEGSSPAEALRRSVELAQHCETLGYHRYWVAEHHSLPAVAASQPAVLIAHVACRTSRIRVGSGGVMLPNHAPLVVAEQFGMLEAFHPGRIDLGIGRAPGANVAATKALGRSKLDEFPTQLTELFHHFDGGMPADHPYAKVIATPARNYRPAMWLLGSSSNGARLAGTLGLPLAFAHHIAGINTVAAVNAYRAAFKPSPYLDKPYLMLTVGVICAQTDEAAVMQASTSLVAMLRLASGSDQRLFPSPKEAASHVFSRTDLEAVHSWTSSNFVRSPKRVRTELTEVISRTGPDELMISTVIHGHEERLESYRLLMQEVFVGEAAAVSEV